MPTKELPPPTTLEGIKRRAKQVKAELGIQHVHALELVAKQAGYSTYAAAKAALESK